jgi:hypothetical protein
MINLPSELLKLQQGNDLRPLKPFAFLFRNKWNPEANKYQLETNPIDITPFVIKPNTLSMTLDVAEVAQYNANNITLTLTDINNRFVEGTPLSYFPEGYQIYGSQVVLYYGTSTTNMTSLFVGVIKDLPSYKPETYQVDLKLISPLELLSDIEAKDFSDKYFGETLIANGTDSSYNPIYKTAHTGVGGFTSIYANGSKMAEGVDYEISQTNSFRLPALVTIINTELRSSTITADYYCWKTGLSVEEVISGLVALAGYIDNTDIRSVAWNSGVKNIMDLEVDFAIGYYRQGTDLHFNWFDGVSSWNNLQIINKMVQRTSIFPEEFTMNFNMRMESESGYWQGVIGGYFIGDELGNNNFPKNGYFIIAFHPTMYIRIYKVENGSSQSSPVCDNMSYRRVGGVQVKNNTLTFFDVDGHTIYQPLPLFFKPGWEAFRAFYSDTRITTENMAFSPNTNSFIIPSNEERYNQPVIKTKVADKTSPTGFWGGLITTLDMGNNTINYSLQYSFSNDNITFSDLHDININADTGIDERYIYFIFQITSPANQGANLVNPGISYYVNSLTLQFINLSGATVLEALQDFALISGYEFGVDRQGVFFFRPRSQSTEPIYTLDHTEIVKVDSIKKELSDFFTKLTLTFAERPLEFYANTGNRPTPIDKYGVINKEIDKPEIINYDNTELAQAIGPQLLSIYSHLSNQLQVTSKLNLALELGDIVNLKRSYPQVVNSEASEQHKYENQQTYYRACKIIGLNYNFEKKQVSYTLEDVSDEINRPID